MPTARLSQIAQASSTAASWQPRVSADCRADSVIAMRGLGEPRRGSLPAGQRKDVLRDAPCASLA